MHQSVKIATLLSLLLVVCSCVRTKKQSNGELSGLLSSVSSDALVVAYDRHCSSVLELLDSAHIFRSLDYGKLSRANAVLSETYIGSLVPALTVASDSSSATILVNSAREHGLYARAFPQGYIVITTSEAQMTSVRRHISENRSILDASGFDKAIEQIGGGKNNYIILRNSGVVRYLPKDFLSGMFPQRNSTRFLDKLAQWTVILPDSGGNASLRWVKGDGAKSYIDVIEAMPSQKSQLAWMMTEDADFAMTQVIELPLFRTKYEEYLDASLRLNSYRQRLAQLKSTIGKDPLNWELELGIIEAAIIRRASGAKLLLIRPSKLRVDSAPEPNPYQGYMEALYGQAYSIPDDSWGVYIGGWLVLGSEAAVREYIESDRIEENYWPDKLSHYILFHSGTLLDWSNQGIRLWNLHR